MSSKRSKWLRDHHHSFMTAGSLSETFSNDIRYFGLTPVRFPVVRRLRLVAQEDTYETPTFLTILFWSLYYKFRIQKNVDYPLGTDVLKSCFFNITTCLYTILGTYFASNSQDFSSCFSLLLVCAFFFFLS